MTKTSRSPALTTVLGRRRFLALGTASLILPSNARGQSNNREVEGGIGGTGIVGLVTEIATLSVAGNRLRLTDETRVSDAFGPVAKDTLDLGDSVTVEATGTVAKRVQVTYPLVGRITDLSASGRRFKVNGVTVTHPNGRIAFTNGARVAVSGLWRGNTVVASRLRQARDDRDLIAGDFFKRPGRHFVGPVRVSGQNIGRAAGGSFVSALGTFDARAGRFTVSDFENARFVGAAGPLQRLSIEGYLEPISTAPGYKISGLGHSFARNLDLSEFEGGKAVFSGDYSGLFDARRAIPLPDSFDAQRRLLRKIRI